MTRRIILMNVILLTVVVNVVSSNVDTIAETKFIRDDYLCKVDERIKFGYSRIAGSGKTSGVIRCLTECSKDNECIGASVDNYNKCFLHGLSPGFMKCKDDKELNHRYWEKYCVHGQWNSSRGECSCFVGVSGVRCNKYFKDCRGLRGGNFSDGDHSILVDPTESRRHPFRIKCQLGNQIYVGFMAMVNKGMDFNKTWSEYELGFEQDDRNLWVGLWKWHQLSYHSPCQILNIALIYGGGYVKIRYSQFKILGREFGYGFDFSTLEQFRKLSNSNFGDCLTGYKNTSFSTWDRDNDGSLTNCASIRGSGWWFSGCNTGCNLLGWGIDDWTNTNHAHKLIVPDFNVGYFKDSIDHISMYVAC